MYCSPSSYPSVGFEVFTAVIMKIMKTIREGLNMFVMGSNIFDYKIN
jgi:hypothetical protein